MRMNNNFEGVDLKTHTKCLKSLDIWEMQTQNMKLQCYKTVSTSKIRLTILSINFAEEMKFPCIIIWNIKCGGFSEKLSDLKTITLNGYLSISI